MSWDWFGHGLDSDPEARRLAAERIGWLREDGWRCRPGWDRKAPLGVVSGPSCTYTISHDGGLLDHLYRLVSPEGEIVYVAEPYWVHDFAALANLDGWDVVASSTQALWYPGHTVAIRFRRERERAA